MAPAAKPQIHLHQNDLPDGLDLGDVVAIDTETTGLSLTRDRLCLAQLSGDGAHCHLVQFREGYTAPNLARLLGNAATTKLFHYGRFDLAMLQLHVGPIAGPLYCTKIASKLVRTYTDRHGLKDLCRELLGIELSKEQQSSDWAAADLSKDQQSYAAQDVLYLHRLRERLDAMLARENRVELAKKCFDFLPTRVALDIQGWPDQDIFAH